MLDTSAASDFRILIKVIRIENSMPMNSSTLRCLKIPSAALTPIFRRFKSAKGKELDRIIEEVGAWDSTNKLPLEVAASITEGRPIPKILHKSVGVSRIKGRREHQEDQYGIEQLPEDVLYVGIFDGHGGSACARFCAQQMPRHIEYWIRERPNYDMVAVLTCAFLEVNNAFARWSYFNKKVEQGSGTTATVCLLHKNVNLGVAHVGDSRAIICRGGEARKLTIDHVPSVSSERTRILKSGGIIVNDRVNERLNMTRSIGDLELKKYGVIAVPLVRVERISHSRDAFLVLTTDGINSVISDQVIVDTVKQASDPTEAAHLVTDLALQCSSEDNSTAIVMPLGSWGKWSAAATIFHSFGRSMESSSRY